MTSREIRGDATLIRRAHDADADLLVAWHDDPEVARYWETWTCGRAAPARGARVVTGDRRSYFWNEPAIRAWRHAGFEDVDEHEPDDDHTSGCLLMEFRS